MRHPDGQVVATDHGAMDVVYLHHEGEDRQLWYEFEWAGKDYGAYILLAESWDLTNEGEKAELLDILGQSAAMTKDMLADEAVGVTGFGHDLVLRMVEGGEDDGTLLDEYLWLRGESVTESAMGDDSFWLGRAERRKWFVEQCGEGRKETGGGEEEE